MCFFVTFSLSRLNIRNKVVPIYLYIKPKLQWKKILIHVWIYIKIILTVLFPNTMESLMSGHIGDLYVVSVELSKGQCFWFLICCFGCKQSSYLESLCSPLKRTKLHTSVLVAGFEYPCLLLLWNSYNYSWDLGKSNHML